MSHKHAKILAEIFKEPVSGNIHWRDVESLLHHLGAETQQHGAKVHVFLGQREGILHRPHKSNVSAKQEIRQLREFLASAGVTPALYEQAHKAAPPGED
jgi:hypothetical protein